MESSHFELIFPANFNQVSMNWHSLCHIDDLFLDSRISLLIFLDGSYGDLEDYLRDMQKIIHDQKESFS